MRFFEDIRVGEKAELGRYVFTAEAIKSFASRYDPQPFHLDEAAAARTHFEKLCASGWHTVCQWMRFVVEQRRRETEAMQARGEPVAGSGPSPGFRELRWLKPVYVDDTVTFGIEVLDLRPSQSRPQWGVMTTRGTAVNQHGEPVLSFISSVFVERRGDGDVE